MSAQPVDVLAVIESAATDECRRHNSQSSDDLIEARAAVAELIEAAEAVRDAPSRASEDAAIYLLEVALKRVQGGAA